MTTLRLLAVAIATLFSQVADAGYIKVGCCPTVDGTPVTKTVSCYIWSEPGATVYWTLETPDGQKRTLGTCQGGTCQSQATGVTLSRSSAYSYCAFKDYSMPPGSKLTCSATHYGSLISSYCLSKASSTYSAPTTSAPTSSDTDKYLVISGGRQTFTQAKSICKGKGRGLPIVKSLSDLAELRKFTTYSDVWVDFTNVYGKFKWADGSCVTSYSSYWYSGEPNNLATEKCGRVSFVSSVNAYRYRTTPCGSAYGYVVCGARTSSPPPSTSAPSPPPPPPPPPSSSESKYLVISGSKTTFSQARSLCSAKGRGLPLLKSFSDLSELRSFTTYADVWVDFTDVYGKFKWSDGTCVSSYSSYWYSGEPNNLSTEKCGRVSFVSSANAYRYRTTPCGYAYGNVVCGPKIKFLVVSVTKTTISYARSQCSARGRGLPRLKSLSELTELRKFTSVSDVWVDFSYADGKFQWADGTSVSTASDLWYSGEPNNLSTEKCGRVTFDSTANAYKYRTTPCDQAYGSIICGPETSSESAPSPSTEENAPPPPPPSQTTPAAPPPTEPPVVTEENKLGTGEVFYDRHCKYQYIDGGRREISCKCDTKDPDSVMTWAIVNPDNTTLDLGACTGLKDDCNNPLGNKIKLSRWRGWGTVSFKDLASYEKSTLVCTASHFGQNNTAYCDLKIRNTADAEWTGDVTFQKYCHRPFPDGKSSKFACTVDTNDPNSVVYWTMVTVEGERIELGKCTGFGDECTVSPESDISLSRWETWSSVKFRNLKNRAGAKLVCTATSNGVNKTVGCDTGTGETTWDVTETWLGIGVGVGVEEETIPGEELGVGIGIKSGFGFGSGTWTGPATLYCGYGISVGGRAAYVCRVPSNDTSGSVQWTMVRNGQSVSVGSCNGLRDNSCRASAGVNVTIIRWYSWSVAVFGDEDVDGATLSCSSTEFSDQTSDSCVIGEGEGDGNGSGDGTGTVTVFESFEYWYKFITSITTTVWTGTASFYSSFTSGVKRFYILRVPSVDSSSTVEWTITYGSGSTINLGKCAGLKDYKCNCPATAEYTIVRWFSWSVITFNDFVDLVGSKVSCKVTSQGQVTTESWSVEEEASSNVEEDLNDSIDSGTDSDARSALVDSSWSTAIYSGETKLFCGSAVHALRKRIYTCRVPSDDPDGTVTWSVVRNDGTTIELGLCPGLKNFTCGAEYGSNVTMVRFYSWSVAVLRDADLMDGASLVCTASNSGRQSSAKCSVGEAASKRFVVVNSGKVSSSVAKSVCEKQGRSLPVIKSAADLDDLRRVTSYSDVWVGLTYDGFDWTWSDGTKFGFDSSYWYSGEPNSLDTSRCGRLGLENNVYRFRTTPCCKSYGHVVCGPKVAQSTSSSSTSTKTYSFW